MMSVREMVLDSLADDYESIKQIENYFKFLAVDFNQKEIEELLEEMINEKLIFVNKEISNEIDGVWYGLTVKGREEQNKLPEQDESIASCEQRKPSSLFNLSMKRMEKLMDYMDDREQEDMGFLCCFCEKSIKSSKTDVTSILVTVNFEKEEKSQYDQLIFCHYNCLKNKLSKDYPLDLNLRVHGYKK